VPIVQGVPASATAPPTPVDVDADEPPVLLAPPVPAFDPPVAARVPPVEMAPPELVAVAPPEFVAVAPPEFVAVAPPEFVAVAPPALVAVVPPEFVAVAPPAVDPPELSVGFGVPLQPRSATARFAASKNRVCGSAVLIEVLPCGYPRVLSAQFSARYVAT